MSESGAKILSLETKSASFKILSGEKALDGSNPTPLNFEGQLKKIHGVQLSIKSSAALADDVMQLSYDIVGAVVNVYAWTNTTGTDPTLVASTSTKTVSYLVFGE